MLRLTVPLLLLTILCACGRTAPEIRYVPKTVEIPVIEPVTVDRRCIETIEPEVPIAGTTYGQIVVHHGRDQEAMRRLNANIRCLADAVKVE